MISKKAATISDPGRFPCPQSREGVARWKTGRSFVYRVDGNAEIQPTRFEMFC